MSGWKKLPLGVDKRSKKISSAIFTRHDLLRKVSTSTDDYVLRPWTTGAGIDRGSLQAPDGVELSFKQTSSDSERRKLRTCGAARQAAGRRIMANLNQLYDQKARSI